MSKQTIPAKTIMTCDACGVECTAKNYRRGGGLAIKEDALDYQGMAVANAGRNYDLCDRCLTTVAKAAEDAIAALTAVQADKGGV